MESAFGSPQTKWYCRLGITLQVIDQYLGTLPGQYINSVVFFVYISVINIQVFVGALSV